MKKTAKVLGSLALAGTMLMSMTGCAMTDVKNTGDEIMHNAFDFHGKKVTKYFDEDDKNYDSDSELFEQYMNNFADYIGVEYDEVKVKSTKIDIKKDDATIDYVFEIDDEEFDYELNLTKDGEDWIIADNEEFIISTWAMYFDIGLELGDKEARNNIKDLMDNYDADDTEELAKEFYEFSVAFIDSHGGYEAVGDYDDDVYEDLEGYEEIGDYEEE